MYQAAAKRYQQVQSTTLSQGELLIALYDGIFRFLNGAKLCFDNNENARGREFLSKVHNIIGELFLALDFKVAPELCANLASIYDFALSRIMDANRDASSAYVEEIIRILSPLREAWVEAVPKAKQESAAGK